MCNITRNVTCVTFYVTCNVTYNVTLFICIYVICNIKCYLLWLIFNFVKLWLNHSKFTFKMVNCLTGHNI